MTIVPFMPPALATIIKRVELDGGVLVLVHVIDLAYWQGIRALWCPNFGGGGWVDIIKYPAAGELCRLVDYQMTRDADNCLAL